MRKVTVFVFAILSGLMIFSSCSKDDDFDESAYIRKDDLFTKEGNMDVQISGTSKNGNAINESMILEYRSNYNPSSYTESDTAYTFFIEQHNGVEGIYNNRLKLEIRYSKAKKEAYVLQYQVNYYKEVDDNSFIKIDSYGYQYNYGNNDFRSEITNWDFDSSTGNISGNVNIIEQEYSYYNDDYSSLEYLTFNSSIVAKAQKIID